MDILHLVDRLEELFNSGRHFPFTNDTIVNEDRFLELIDQLRVTIPEENSHALSLASVAKIGNCGGLRVSCSENVTGADRGT